MSWPIDIEIPEANDWQVIDLMEDTAVEFTYQFG